MGENGEAYLLMLLCLLLHSGHLNSFDDGILYDYSATTKCLALPGRALYGGGIFGDSMNWTAKTRLNVELEKGKLYAFSAWVQISKGSGIVVDAVFRTSSGELHNVGKAIASNGCWSMLKGGLTPSLSGLAEISFQSKDPTAEVWVENVSLQPFTKNQWRSHQDQIIEKVRKSKVRFRVMNRTRNTPLPNASITINQTTASFPFGSGLNFHILSSKPYRRWFASRFKYTTFTNAMKWYSTELVQGQENYTTPDAMLRFCRRHNISIRGHNIFWDNPKCQPQWVKNLTGSRLREAAAERMNSVVSRYRGDLIAWDVVNENLHFSFFEDRLGKNASAEYFRRAREIDPGVRLFMNEYNTVENNSDDTAHPVNYLKRFAEILAYPGNEGIPAGIGLQSSSFGHGQPDLAYMRSALDLFGSMGLPVWLTEVSVAQGPNQAEYLEQILWEGYSHPAVKGIIMFGGPEEAGYKELILADKEFRNTEAGDVVDQLLQEWRSQLTEGETNSEGLFEASLFHGDYEIMVKNPAGTNSATSLIRYKLTGSEPAAPGEIAVVHLLVDA